MSTRLPALENFDAIGAPWQLDTAEPLTDDLRVAIRERIELFDRTYSRFREDSLVSRIARTPGTHEFPADAATLFATYRALYEGTDGAMSPLVGRAMEDLGYDRAYSLTPSASRGPVPAWDDSFAWDGHALTTVRPVVVDVGAAGKGYLVDIIGDLLRDAGLHDFIVDGSGDLLHAGADGIRVGLEHPRDASKAIGIAHLTGGSLCASASNRRAWGPGLHHVIDATTGLPTTSVIATWAMAPSAVVADGLATALFFTSPERLSALGDFHYVRMMSTGRVEHSPGFPGEIFV